MCCGHVLKSNIVNMRQVILPFLILLTLGANARNFYVSASGNDSNNGLSASTPWKTISKVNASFASIAAGDSILFRKGDVFYGTLVVGKSGSSGKPIVFASYGTAAAMPVFTGFVSVSSWSLVSSGIYQATVPGAKNTLNLVTVSGVPQARGRYPNADAANGGYLSYESFSGYTSITDNQLTSAINWTGGEAVIRKSGFVTDRCPITSHSGTTITYKSPTTYVGSAGYGYFIQDHPKTLDKFGEWYLNKSTKQLQMFFGTASPSAYPVKVSTLDTLIGMNGKGYITIRDLAFEGANANTIYAFNCNNISVINCNVLNAGESGVMTWNTSNFLADGVTTNNTLNNGIFGLNSKVSNATIRNCVIKNNGLLAGMGLSSGNSYKGMRIDGNFVTIEYNRLDSIGYSGIEFQGNDILVKNNVVSRYDMTKHDGGGIYTWGSGTSASPGPTYYRRTVQDNIIMNPVGAPYGTRTNTVDVVGIFLDGMTMNVNVVGNTILNVDGNGLQLNNPEYITLRNNTIFNNAFGVSIVKWAWGDIKSVNVKGNIFYSKSLDQKQIYYVNSDLTTSLDAAVKSIGSIDSNIYSNVNPVGFAYDVYQGSAIPTSPNSMEAWQSFSSFDRSGKNVAKLPTAYKLNSLIGANKFSNSTFTSNIASLTLFGANVSAIWDNTSKIAGGALRMSFSAPAANRYGMVHSPIGAVSSSKKYILRVSTLGTTVKGIIRAYIRKTASPYTNLTPVQVKTFGTTTKNHEFLFDAPATDAGGSFVIEIEQNSGTTYLDNISFYEADATTYDFDKQLRVEYNDTKNAKTVSLGANYRGVDGTLYSGTITLKPYTSAILVQDTGTVSAPSAPSAPSTLTAKSTSGTIGCYGNTTNVTVSGSGGKSPYTGTGTFNVSAGKGSVAIATKTANAGRFTFLYYTIGAISSAKNYVLKFSTIRNTGTAALRASLRQTQSPYNVLVNRQTTTIGTSRVDHEFYFNAPPNEAQASFFIELEQTAGVTYLDNLGVFEVNSAKQITSANLYTFDGQFETGANGLFSYSGATPNHTLAWDNTGKINSIYYFPIKDAAGAVTVAEVKTSQPSAALRAFGTTSNLITTLGGTTTITVSASGGTAPYTGLGSFKVGTGTWSYMVTDANGCQALAKFVIGLTAGKTTTTATTTDAALKIAATSGELKLTASPNPSSTSFNLYVQGNTAEKVMITVYNADGRVFYQSTGAANANYTFGGNFTQGVYIVKVVQGNTVQTLKLVKSI